MVNWIVKGYRPKFPTESWVKKQVKDILNTLKEDGFGVWYFMPQGTTIGRTGIPDFLVCIEGRMVAIETKKSGGKISKLQTKELKDLTYSRAYTYVVNEDALLGLWNELYSIAKQVRI